MSTATVRSFTLVGTTAVPVTIEVELLRRLPSIVIVGLPSASVRESAERVRSAIVASGFEFPRQRVVVSITPADIRHSGQHFDLPIAIAILVASGQLPACFSTTAAGELSLAGEVRAIRGAVAMGIAADGPLLLPMDNAFDAGAVSDHPVDGLVTLAQLATPKSISRVPARYVGTDAVAPRPSLLDFADIRGNLHAIPLLVEAARTRRPVLLVGPAGCGKTMLAARMPGLLPSLTREEAVEVMAIHDVAGLHAPGTAHVASVTRPFRAPHHTVSAAGLVGGASLRPGEASLAHQGVLFLDEFPEFPRATTEVLVGPARDGELVLARSTGRVVLPSKFWLVASANHCPCGSAPVSWCGCTLESVARYNARLDRQPLLKDAVVIELERPVRGEEGERWPSTAELRATVARGA